MTSSKIFFYLCISFIAGIFINSAIKIPQMFLWAFLFLGILFIFVFQTLQLSRRSSPQLQRGLVFGFCVLFFVLGILRHQISMFNIENNKLAKFNDTGEIVLIGQVMGDPDRRDTFQKLKIKAEKVNYADVSGAVMVILSRYPKYYYLDKVKIIGKLEMPAVMEDFNYKNYLLKDGIYSVMAFPKVELIGKNSGSPSSAVFSGVLFFKQKLRESIRRNFLPPQSSIMEATLLGDSGQLSEDLKNKLNVTGLRHIIAVSGTHVIILSSILISLFLALGLWRNQAFYFSVVLIFFYIILTGLSASGIRAGIMGGLYLLAQKLGRQSIGPRPVAMAGAVMLALNPLLLFYDIGFQLSFLAVLGLIYLEPIINFFIKVGWRKILFFLKFNSDGAGNGRINNFVSIASATFAAQIFTLPVIMYNFGNISFFSPITNILVLPVVYLLMVFGFLSAVFGAASKFLGWIFSIPCQFFLFYFVKIIEIFSQPWLAKTISDIHWIWLIISYFLIAVVVRFLNKKLNQRF